MSVFDRRELTFAPIESADCAAFRSSLVRLGMPPDQAQRKVARLFGSVVEGVCSVEDGPRPAQPEQLAEAFICPDCGKPLHYAGVFTCPACGPFEQRSNVHMLLPHALASRLYGPAA